MKHTTLIRLILFGVFTSITAHADDNKTLPSVASLDYCADQYILALANDHQIKALSPEARMSHSFYRVRAMDKPLFKATTEDVLLLKPDMVLRSWNGTPQTLNMIKEHGIPVHTVTYGEDINSFFNTMLTFGTLLNQTARAQALVEDYRKRLSNLKNAPKLNLTATYITSFGFTAGTDTYINEIIELAGLKTTAQTAGIKQWQALPLEQFLINPPDVIIGGFFDAEDPTPSNWSFMRHPQFAKKFEDIPTIMVSGGLLSCGGTFLIDAAEYIRAKAGEIIDEE